MKHIISVLTENHFGVLARISGLFSARGFNIDSLTVGETDNPKYSRMTIVVKGDENILEQVMKQLNKLIDVVKVIDLKSEKAIIRDLILVKVTATKTNRAEIMQIVNIFKAKVVDISHSTLTIEMTGIERKVNALIDMLKPFGIKEIARTGIISMARG